MKKYFRTLGCPYYPSPAKSAMIEGDRPDLMTIAATSIDILNVEILVSVIICEFCVFCLNCLGLGTKLNNFQLHYEFL